MQIAFTLCEKKDTQRVLLHQLGCVGRLHEVILYTRRTGSANSDTIQANNLSRQVSSSNVDKVVFGGGSEELVFSGVYKYNTFLGLRWCILNKNYLTGSALKEIITFFLSFEEEC